MNIQKISDKDLLARTRELAAKERELLSEILHHLREVERRRLFSDLGYKSLYEYATKELCYSEDQAYRRINAMRLLKELPQLEEKITDGSLSLSTISVATSLFKAESKHNAPLPKEKKLDLIDALTNKSRREAEVIVQKFTSLPKETLRPARERTVEGGIETKMFIKDALGRKIEKIKGILAHSDPAISNAELFEKLCDEFLEKHEKKMSPRAKNVPQTSAAPRDEESKNSAPPRNTASDGTDSNALSSSSDKRQIKRSLSAEVQRYVWARDHGQCVQCGSTYALQIDHIKPRAHGGSDDAKNLRLLCRSCNQRAAIVALGQYKMQRYLDRPQ